ncbi:MAG: electron transfer flavoprotein subunit beta/FixA family protein, partial [Magnetococcales bacterium]|nr:electron transfer flavoprotein subunit beta/FixA family protein [Magnetococcales bacterium]
MAWVWLSPGRMLDRECVAMNVLVAVKSVPDPAHAVRLHHQDGRVDLDDLPLTLNPFDAIALEEAVRWREQGHVAQVVAASIGPASWGEGLRTTLALGADRAILVESDTPLAPLDVARCLRQVALRE